MPDVRWLDPWDAIDDWHQACVGETVVAACGSSLLNPKAWRLHYKRPYRDGGWVERVESTAVSNVEEAKATVLALWRMAGSIT